MQADRSEVIDPGEVRQNFTATCAPQFEAELEMSFGL
jgi:hypothetical protein